MGSVRKGVRYNLNPDLIPCPSPPSPVGSAPRRDSEPSCNKHRHCEPAGRGNPLARRTGLPRRFATRNDGMRHAACGNGRMQGYSTGIPPHVYHQLQANPNRQSQVTQCQPLSALTKTPSSTTLVLMSPSLLPESCIASMVSPLPPCIHRAEHTKRMEALS